MKLTGIKKLRSESDVVSFLVKNEIPFEFDQHGTITVKQIDGYGTIDMKRSMFICNFRLANFHIVTRHTVTNELLFCDRELLKVIGRNEFTPTQVEI
jgi:hypothetical protein